MKQKAEEYAWLLDTMFDGVYMVETNRRIVYWNPSAERLTGYASSEMCGHYCSDNRLRHVDDQGTLLCLNQCPLAAAMADGVASERLIYLHHKAGHRLPVIARTSPVRNPQGEIIGGLEVFSDATAFEGLQGRVKELESLAFIDPLTEVANRRFTDLTLARRMDELSRYSWPFGIFIADIDFFKKVNDTYGHDMGDRLLRVIAQTLAHNSRSSDIIGRWGGEEFVGILQSVDAALLTTLCERLRVLVAESAVRLEDRRIVATISIGATLARPDDTPESVVRRADEGLYLSKEKGRNRVTVLP